MKTFIDSEIEQLKEACLEIKFDGRAAINWVTRNCVPSDVFSVEDLKEWAEDWGYVLKEEESK